MHRLLTRETTSFILMRGHGIGSRYERQPDGSALVTAVNYRSGVEVEVATETTTIPFDDILAEIDHDDIITHVR